MKVGQLKKKMPMYKKNSFFNNESKLETIPNRTRGPRGPWVAHLRKRSKVTVEPKIENPRGII